LSLRQEVLDTRDALVRQGFEEAEVFYKRGRSRTVIYGPQSLVVTQRREEGWAVRAGDRRRSFFHAATGSPDPDTPWPEADGLGLRLPSPRPVPRWSAPSSLDAPLVGEAEARGFFEGLVRELDDELPGARLLTGHLDDGSSESQVASSREVKAEVRHRVAVLHLEAVIPPRRDGTPHRATLLLAERDARRFSPSSIARRLADQLAVALHGEAPKRDRCELLLAPSVAITLLSAFSRYWLGPGATGRAAELNDRRGHIGSASFSLVDDGRLPGGLLEAPVDGEGQPSRETVLVEKGVFRQPLLAWWQTSKQPALASGCCRRASWRSLPEPGPTHLYVPPNLSLGPAALLQDLSRGYYLLSTEGAPRVDPEVRRFALPVSGFAIDSGRSVGSVHGAWLVGSISSFLNGVLAAARDLTFQVEGGGLVGSPTLYVRGLELRHEP
jgi:predicted Zn-dependent protease